MPVGHTQTCIWAGWFPQRRLLCSSSTNSLGPRTASHLFTAQKHRLENQECWWFKVLAGVQNQQKGVPTKQRWRTCLSLSFHSDQTLDGAHPHWWELFILSVHILVYSRTVPYTLKWWYTSSAGQVAMCAAMSAEHEHWDSGHCKLLEFKSSAAQCTQNHYLKHP